VAASNQRRLALGGAAVFDYRTSVDLVDWRTGRVLHKEILTRPPTSAALPELQVLPGHKVEARYQDARVILAFTDEKQTAAEEEKLKQATLGLAAADDGGRNLGTIPVPQRVVIPVEDLPAIPLPLPIAPPVPR